MKITVTIETEPSGGAYLRPEDMPDWWERKQERERQRLLRELGPLRDADEWRHDDWKPLARWPATL